MVRKFLVAGFVCAALAAPAHAGVLGVGGGGAAGIGLGGGAANADIGLGTRVRTGGVSANTSADAHADADTPDVGRAASRSVNGGAQTVDTKASATSATAMHAAQRLQSMGYSKVQLMGSEGAAADANLKFDAVNPDGKNVLVTMNAETNSIVEEHSKF